MTLQHILLKKHAKSTTESVINWVGDDVDRFDSLMKLVLGQDQQLAQRAAWAMSYLVTEQPQLIYPYLDQLLTSVQQPVHDAIKRNTFRFLKEIEIPESSLSLAVDTCFKILENKKESIAVTCFALHTLLHYSKIIPELKNEILFVLELHQDTEAPAVRSTIRKVKKAFHLK